MVRKIANKISNYNRHRKFNYFLAYFKPTSKTRILDVGPSENEYQENANIIEKKYPYPEMITALGIETFKEFRKRYPKVTVVTYAGGIFPLNNDEFDICWSNAVLEHVTSETERERFIKEIRRVSRAAFVTTPNKYFPFETHTKIFLLHWLPKNIFDWILIKLRKEWASGNYMRLMSKSDIIKLLTRCGITSYRIIENKILWFTMDFVIIF